MERECQWNFRITQDGAKERKGFLIQEEKAVMSAGRLAILRGNVETREGKMGKTGQGLTRTKDEKRKSTKGATIAIAIAVTEAEKNVREN